MFNIEPRDPTSGLFMLTIYIIVPGLNLDQFIPADLGNTTLTILNGEVIVELNDQKKNFSLNAEDIFQVKKCLLSIFLNIEVDE